MIRPGNSVLILMSACLTVCCGCQDTAATANLFEEKGVTIARDMSGGVKTIRFDDFEPSDADLKQLSAVETVQEVFGNGTRITDIGLEALQNAKRLSVISLTGSAVSAKGIMSLARLPKLTELNLSGARTVDDAAMTALKSSPGLVSLGLDNTSITDAGLAEIVSIRSLKSLSVNGTSITAQGLAMLVKSMPDLEVLHLSDTAVSDAGVQSLVECSHLTHLELRNCDLTDAAIESLASMQSLRVLDLAGNGDLTDAAILKLGTLPNLTSLDVSGTELNGIRFNAAGFLQLASLNAAGTKVTDAAVPDFMLPTLYSLGLKNTATTESGIRKIFAENHQTAVAFGE